MTARKGCPSASAVSLRPRSPPRILILFCHDFLFDFSVWWWRGEVGFLLEGETGGIQIRTRFCQTIFWGKGFGKTSAEFPARRRGLGRNPRGVRFWIFGGEINKNSQPLHFYTPYARMLNMNKQCKNSIKSAVFFFSFLQSRELLFAL